MLAASRWLPPEEMTRSYVLHVLPDGDELLIKDGQATFAIDPCGSSTNLAATPLSNSA